MQYLKENFDFGGNPNAIEFAVIFAAQESVGVWGQVFKTIQTTVNGGVNKNVEEI